MTKAEQLKLRQIIAEISDFERHCDDDRGTDVGEMWELLHAISDKLAALADQDQ